MLFTGKGRNHRFVIRHEPVDIIHMNEALPTGTRHELVDLGNNQAGVLHACFGNVYRNAQTDISVSIRRAYLNKRHIESNPPVREQSGNL